MACKQLTFEGRFESGITENFEGKALQFAYTAALNEKHNVWQLGIAVANQAGYTPVPLHWAHADTYQEMQDEANRLNDELGLDRKQAAIIVATTIGAQHRASPAERAQLERNRRLMNARGL